MTIMTHLLKGNHKPKFSLDFASGTAEYLAKRHVDFPSYDRSKFSISLWFKRGTTGTTQTMQSKGFAGLVDAHEWLLRFLAGDKIQFRNSINGTTVDGILRTSTTFTSTTTWHHVLAVFDVNNVTATDRMKLYVDGVEPSFDTDTTPTAAPNPVTNGGFIWGSSGAVFPPTIPEYDGLLYQMAFFSGVAITPSEVYDNGSPVDILSKHIAGDISGLISLVDARHGNVKNDALNTIDYINVNSVITSTDIPT